jgi:hypothetical protein
VLRGDKLLSDTKGVLGQKSFVVVFFLFYSFFFSFFFFSFGFVENETNQPSHFSYY